MEDQKQKIEALIKKYHEECDEEDYDDFVYRQFLSSGHCDYKTWKYNHECSATHRDEWQLQEYEKKANAADRLIERLKTLIGVSAQDSDSDSE